MPLDNTMRSLINDEILSLFDGFIEVVSDKADEHEKMLVDLIEDSGELIHEDTAKTIIGALELGAALCLIVEDIKIDDELLAKKLTQAKESYERAAVMAAQLIEEITLEDEDEDADDSDNDDDGAGKTREENATKEEEASAEDE